MSDPAEVYVYCSGKWVSISPLGNGTGGSGNFTLTPATAATLGGVKIGSNVSVSGDGTISVDKFSGSYSDLTGAPALATVATTGSYTDLSGRPVKVSDLTNDAGYINAAQVPPSPVSSVNGKTGAVVLAATDVGALPSNTLIPSNTSDLKNDSGFINLAQAADAAPIQSITQGNNIAITDDGHGHLTIAAVTTGGGGSGISSVSGIAPIVVADGLTAPKISLNVGDGLMVTSNSLTLNVASLGLKAVATSGDYNDLINLPPTPPAQVQSDWSESNSSLVSFIKGKPTNLSEFTNDSGYINLAQVPAAPVSSVNGKTGAVVLAATDVGALPSTTAIPTHTSNLTNDSGFINLAQVPAAPVSSVNGKTGAVVLDANSVGALPNTTTIPTHTSNLTNDSGYINLAQVPAAPVSSVNGKTGAVVLDANSVGALPNTTIIPTHTSNLTNDSGYITLSQVPDAPVQSIKAGSSNVTVSDDGAGNFTIDANAGSTYTLPPANTTTLGGVIVGDGLNVAANGTLSLGDLHLPVTSEDGSVVLQDASKYFQVLTEGATRMKVGVDGTEAIGQIKAGRALVGSTTGDGLPSISIGGGPAFDNGGGTASVVQVSKSLKGTVNTITGFLNQVGFVNCAVGTYRGIVQSNPDAAFFGTTTVQTYEGFSISAMPSSLDAKVLDACSIHVAMNDSATATRWNVKATGSAPNMFSGNVVIGSSNKPEVALEVHPQRGLALKTSYPPSSTNTLGVRGELAWDSQYLYLCVNDNDWRRVPLQNFDGSPATRIAFHGTGSGIRP